MSSVVSVVIDDFKANRIFMENLLRISAMLHEKGHLVG